MTTQRIDVERVADAGPAAVFQWLGDSATWPDWTPIDAVEILVPGGTDGVGEVRVFRNGRFRVRERIVERVPPRRLTYVLLAGLPVRDYRAEIELVAEGAGAGTRIRWRTRFAAKVPGTGWILRRALTRATEQFADGLARVATADISR